MSFSDFVLPGLDCLQYTVISHAGKQVAIKSYVPAHQSDIFRLDSGRSCV
ncbi:hypothetical protein ACM5Q9_02995 [Advenella sp. RU8]